MPTRILLMAFVAAGLFLVHDASSIALGQEAEPTAVAQQGAAATTEPISPAAATTDAPTNAPPRRAIRKLPEPKGAKRLSPDYDVWVDPKEGAVIVDGQISLREGMLEMFACLKNTKEHESIVSANTKAYLVHAGLVALGAKAGHPVKFVPDYKPPEGTEIEVLVQYTDEDGNEETVRAQDWIKDIRTEKAMAYPWVFGGSLFWVDPENGKRYYQAERGDFICVSNFGTAMLDIPVPSSSENEELAFQTFTDRIPPLGTPVRLLLKPKLKKDGVTSEERGASKPTPAASGGEAADATDAGKAESRP